MAIFKSYIFESTIPCGECFQYAYRLFKQLAENNEDVALVHGTVTNPISGNIFKHAWVVWQGHIYDWQSGGKKSSIKQFKSLWSPVITNTYLTADLPEVLKLIVQTKHYGPW